MDFVSCSKEEKIATVVVNRGKVNAINETLVDELTACFEQLAEDPEVSVVILTGTGKFFSFGFDIPEFLGYSQADFTRFLTKFAGLYHGVFLFPKAVIAALNGHTIAGACMLATACDYRLMVTGKARISLNEITFGASVSAGSVAMLKECVGRRNAQAILYSGAMYSAEEAFEMGLADKITTPERVMEDAKEAARQFALRAGPAFTRIKGLLRKPIADEMKRGEQDSLRDFVEIWYSDEMRERLRHITIRG